MITILDNGFMYPERSTDYRRPIKLLQQFPELIPDLVYNPVQECVALDPSSQATYACFAPRLLLGQRARQTYGKGVVLQAGETTLNRCQHTGHITPEQSRDIEPQTGKSLTT